MHSKLFLCFALGAGFALFNYANAQTLEVTSTGVGIGTASPSTTLQVVGPITAGASGGSTQGVDYLYGYYGNGKLFTIGSQYSSAASFLGYGVKAKSGAVGYVSSTALTIGRSAFEANNGHLAFWTGASQASTDGGSVSLSERMRIDSSGHVGMGTTSPGGLLHVSGDFVSAYMQLTLQSSAGDDRVGMSFWNAAGSARLASFYAGNDGHSYFSATEVSGGTFHIYSAGAERMTFLSSGNVGIGTASPGYKLEVSGSVRATSFIANSNTYADFVFAPDYQLASLSEVEAAIQAHGHLPDIPSAAEAKTHGVDLAEMQVKLLQKVEELTLYLVAHEKELQAQKQAVRQLQEENAALRHQVSDLEKR